MKTYRKVVKYPLVGFDTAEILRVQDLINGGLDMYVLDEAEISVSQEGGTFIVVTMREKTPTTFGEKLKYFFTKQNLGFEVRLVLQQPNESDSDYADRVKLGAHRYSVLYLRGRGELVQQHDVTVPCLDGGPELHLAILLFQRQLQPENMLKRHTLIHAVENMLEPHY